ncbi:hypothetical protein [Sporosalibacterium faouarense]|uniref:hypothetical protein n=1 Tax=Sporosalibacterium faouarense TaxID=516123 RepID=UPI00192B0FE8|nr:hypothetical protein [Sporosalibacterium faouarense]
MSFKIFILLLIIGIILPHLINMFLELLPMRNTIDNPKDNSTLVMKPLVVKNDIRYNLRKIIYQFISL